MRGKPLVTLIHRLVTQNRDHRLFERNWGHQTRSLQRFFRLDDGSMKDCVSDDESFSPEGSSFESTVPDSRLVRS